MTIKRKRVKFSKCLKEVFENLFETLGQNLKQNEKLASHTTFGIGGEALFFYVARKPQDLIQAVQIAKEGKIPFFVLGGGSNVLVSDSGFKGLVIKNQCDKIFLSEEEITCQSGVFLYDLVSLSCENSLSGVEFAAGIPGTIGGAVYGNAGAFGKAVGDLLSEAIILNSQGKIEKVKKEYFEFGYRTRLFAEGKLKSPTEGKHPSDLTKLKISIANRKPNPTISQARKELFAKGKLVPWNKGKHHMQKEKHPLWNKPCPEYVKIKVSEGLKRWYKEHEHPKTMLGMHHSEETKQKISMKCRKLWENPEFKEKAIRNSLKALFIRPTSLEKKLIELIQKYSLPFKYCGDGSLIISGFNPDFMESNGRKLLIETANRIHHNENYEKQRYAIFAKYGFRTLILWWEDFFADKYGKKMKKNWEKDILNKIKLFSYEP